MTLALALVFVLGTPPAPTFAPMGFALGEKAEGVKCAPGASPPELVRFCECRRPHPELGVCAVAFDSEGRVVKVVGIGEVQSDRYGTEVKRKLDRLRAALTARYGAPTFASDGLRAGAMWRDADEWMMALRSGERAPMWSWDAPGGVSILLRATHGSGNAAFVTVAWEAAAFAAVKRAFEARADEGL